MNWITERNPTTIGRYLCTTADGVVTCHYDSSVWRYNGNEVTVYAWQALPEAYRRPQIDRIEEEISALKSKLETLKYILNGSKDNLLSQIEKTLRNTNIDIETYIDIELHEKEQNA